MINVKDTVDRWCELAEYLNNKIQKDGQIQINQHGIWQKYLHKFTNEDWKSFVYVLEIVRITYPRYFKDNDENAMLAAIMALDNDELYIRMRDLNDYGYTKKPILSVLDIPGDKGRKGRWNSTKGIAWKLMMTMREVHNRIAGQDVPNEDPTPPDPKQKTTVFTSPLFDHEGKR